MTTDGSQEFCLRWNNHQATIISVFDYLLENETLVDCTLAAEGQYLKAHKVVLCACSPYLELLLSQHNDKHPILIFKDIKFNELKSMIDYMYKGEVNIAQDQLNHFLKAAESLQIKGLSESEDDATPQTATPTPRPPPPRAPPAQRTQPRPFNNAVAIRSTGPSDVDPDSPKRIIGRPEAQSPTPRKRRRQAPVPGRPSLSGDDASNASEGHFDQSNCDVPTPAHSTSTSLVPSGDSEKAVAKVETNSELMLEPKTEYDDNSVEDITLDDDDEDYSQAGTSQMDNSQGNFGNWQQMVGDQTGDDVFSGQDTGAQNSQDEISIQMEKTRAKGVHMYGCMFCDYKTNGKLDMKDHLRNHYIEKKAKEMEMKSEKCSFCDFRSNRVRSLKAHLNTHIDQAKLQCPTCDFRTRLPYTLKRHALIHTSEPPYKCDNCDYGAYRPKNLEAHVNKYHKHIKPYKCETCPYRATSKDILIKHVKRCSGVIICITPENVISNKESDNRIDSLDLDTFKNDEKIKVEKYDELADTDNGGKNSNKQLIILKCPLLSCKFCHTTFNDEKELIEHTSCHLHEQINISTEIIVEPVGEYSRPVEELVDSNEPSVQEEEYVLIENTEEKDPAEEKVPKSCGICDFNTYGIMDLQKHIFESHADTLPCDQCEVVCQTIKQLVKHKQHVHQVKALICKYCSSNCNEKKQYDDHMSSHNGKYKCSKCDFESKYKRVVLEHSFLHMDLKPYRCSCCEFKSFRASNLVRHQYTHSTMKPLKCPECSYSTIQKTCLTRHMTKHLQS